VSSAIERRSDFSLTAFTPGQAQQYGELTTSIGQFEIVNLKLDVELAKWRKIAERKDEFAELLIKRELEVAAIKHGNEVLVLKVRQKQLEKQLCSLQGDIERHEHADALATAKGSVDEARKAAAEERRLRQKSDGRVAELTRLRGRA
jgi:hypothetical protein